MRSPSFGAGWLARAASEPRSARADQLAIANGLGSLLGASWLAVRRAPLIAPSAAAVVLIVISWPSQDNGRAIDAMHGPAVLLACAWAGTTEDPDGEVIAASPYPMRVRVAARLAVGLAVVLPIYLIGVSSRADGSGRHHTWSSKRSATR